MSKPALPSPDAPAVARRVWLVAGLLVACVVAAYYNSLAVPLLFDDRAAIADNRSITDLRNLGAVFSPPPEAPTAGRPLLNLSFALNHAAGGRAVTGYHVVNLALHAGAALLLFGLVRRIVAAGVPACRSQSRQAGTPAATALALSVAVLWAVHPLQTASVTYLSQRAEVLMGVFYLGTLYAGVRAAAQPRGPWSGVAVTACALGMLAKETMLSAPIVMLLCDRTFFAGTFREALRRRAGMYAGLAATWLILAALMIGTDVEARGIGYGAGVGAWTYGLAESRALVTYLQLALWPSPLIFDYGTGANAAHLGAAWPYAGAVALLLAATVVGLHRGWVVALFPAVFFLILAPTSSFVPIAHQPVAENRMYLPLAAVLALLVWGVHAAFRQGRAVALGVLALALAALTVRRNADYRDALTLWRDTVAKRPDNVRAHSHLGEALRAAGDLRGAQVQFETAVRLQPDYAPAHNNLGLVLSVNPAQQDAALAHFEAALRAAPRAAPVHNNYAVALSRVLGREAKAQEHFREAIRLAPAYAEPHKNLANLLMMTPGASEEALREYSEALRLSPGDADAHANLGFGLAVTRYYAEAVRQCEAALRLKPDHVRAHVILGNTLLQLAGRTPEAIVHYRRAVQLEPGNAEAWAMLGLVLTSIPAQREEGIAALREALRLNPALKVARDALERVAP